ncbi:unnamed protein product [Vitrella brassicaformis CCMP3155]|uniref:Uncharacterized protein n=1 Tax=Vitrella brassicaformis (strain CCMP3155) TaxID=1169540 RepID=A0A0G4EL04_VITBC|nr:unnamed protein product [Vitrella brassicaformis CCMP3155]|eukprot:CEL97611.1 unnamed protein product [Vitrella brassicaformis CCMP3155]
MAASCSSDAIGPKEDSSATADESAQAQAAHPLSDDEEIKPELSAMISDTPGLLDCVIVFLSLHLLVYLSRHMREAVAPHHTRLVISAADKEEWSLWERIPIGLVKRLAASLTRLTSLIFRYPFAATLWCFDVFITFVEGHAEGRRTANMQGGSLQTIVLEWEGSLSSAMLGRLQRRDPPLPPPAVPPPTLDALTSITLLGGGHGILANRDWRMPSLARVGQTGWSYRSLGRFISTSRRLQHVDGDFSDGDWAKAFEHLPVGDGGQPGPLSQLKSMGKIWLFSVDETDRLQATLSSRGCRKALPGLHVSLSLAAIDVPDRTVARLCALDRLINSCCTSPDVPVRVSHLDGLSLKLDHFHTAPFPSNPTPTFRRTIQQVVQKASGVYFHLTDGPLPPATEAAIDLARTLSFDSATEVEVEVSANATIPSQDSMIISHLQQLPPRAGLLFRLYSARAAQPGVAGAVGAMMAAKMHKYVQNVDLAELLGEDAVRVLEGLGRDREVGIVRIRWANLEQLTSTTATLPAIDGLAVVVAQHVGDEQEAAHFNSCLVSLCQSVRGLKRVDTYVDVTETAVPDVVELLDRGTKLGSDFSVTDFSVTNLRRGHGTVKVTATRDTIPQAAAPAGAGAGAGAVVSRGPPESHEQASAPAAASSAGRPRVAAEMVDDTEHYAPFLTECASAAEEGRMPHIAPSNPQSGGGAVAVVPNGPSGAAVALSSITSAASPPLTSRAMRPMLLPSMPHPPPRPHTAMTTFMVMANYPSPAPMIPPYARPPLPASLPGGTAAPQAHHQVPFPPPSAAPAIRGPPGAPPTIPWWYQPHGGIPPNAHGQPRQPPRGRQQEGRGNSWMGD